MKIKVCGITDVKQFNKLVTMGIDYLGMIFYSESKRFVVGKIDPDEVRENKSVTKVGVFVNEYADELQRYVEEFGLDAVQLHGDENESYLGLLSPDLIKIKAIKFGNQSAQELQTELDRFKGLINYYLLDTQTESHGGSGKKFDWNILSELNFSHPFFLSGGISADDAKAIAEIEAKQSQLFAIDINSRFETAPGIKNIELIKNFKDEITQ